LLCYLPIGGQCNTAEVEGGGYSFYNAIIDLPYQDVADKESFNYGIHLAGYIQFPFKGISGDIPGTQIILRYDDVLAYFTIDHIFECFCLVFLGDQYYIAVCEVAVEYPHFIHIPDFNFFGRGFFADSLYDMKTAYHNQSQKRESYGHYNKGFSFYSSQKFIFKYGFYFIHYRLRSCPRCE
jgi:hypothetical protein